MSFHDGAANHDDEDDGHNDNIHFGYDYDESK